MAHQPNIDQNFALSIVTLWAFHPRQYLAVRLS